MTTTDRRRAPSRKEYVTVPVEVKNVDGSKHQFEAYSATWDLDLGNDIIQKGAFTRTLNAFRAAANPYIPLVDSHSYDSIFDALGHLVEGEEDERGLKTLWQVTDGIDGERVMDRLRSGTVRKTSIGYVPIQTKNDTIQRDGRDVKVRRLLEIKWEETSLVIFPMNPAADVTAVKCFSDLADALRTGDLTPDQKRELRALLAEEEAPSPDGASSSAALAPDDPVRLAMEEAARDVILRSLAARA